MRLPRWSREVRRVTTFDHPLRISDPTIGFLNLAGEPGAALANADRMAMSTLFKQCTNSSADIPKCDVLFLYCNLDEDGSISGFGADVGEVIAAARAYVAVVASENRQDRYLQAHATDGPWHANVAMTLNRKGDSFARFWHEIFAAMFGGKSMLLAWAAIAPQSPHQPADLPGMVMAARAGHVTFAR